jgi:hypothetical protein
MVIQVHFEDKIKKLRFVCCKSGRIETLALRFQLDNQRKQKDGAQNRRRTRNRSQVLEANVGRKADDFEPNVRDEKATPGIRG